MPHTNRVSSGTRMAPPRFDHELQHHWSWASESGSEQEDRSRTGQEEIDKETYKLQKPPKLENTRKHKKTTTTTPEEKNGRAVHVGISTTFDDA